MKIPKGVFQRIIEADIGKKCVENQYFGFLRPSMNNLTPFQITLASISFQICCKKCRFAL
jgi:hypothetical protein